MSLLFFHGEEILILLAGACVGLALFAVMMVWASFGPARSWTVPIVYLVIGMAISLAEIFTDSFLGLSVMFAFPWSLLLLTLSTVIDQDIGLIWFIPSIVVNAALVYLVARYQSR